MSAWHEANSNPQIGNCVRPVEGTMERFTRVHSLLESREVAIDGAATEVVDKWQVFTDVFHRPAAEEAVQQALVPSWQQQK